jgi:hypothetical protein
MSGLQSDNCVALIQNQINMKPRQIVLFFSLEDPITGMVYWE